MDSKEVAFRAAGKYAFLDAIEKAKPVLLEPIVNMEVTVPSDYMGDAPAIYRANADESKARTSSPAASPSSRRIAPLGEVMQYQSQLKSVTGGQGSFAMEFSHYEPVPPQVQQQIVAQYKPKQEVE